MTRTLINTLTIPVATHSTMKITNVVYSAHLNCTIDLISLCQRLRSCRYEPRSFPSLIWQHRNIGGNCLVFANGVINLMEKHLASVRVDRDFVDMPGCCKNMDAQCTSQMPRSSRSRPSIP